MKALGSVLNFISMALIAVTAVMYYLNGNHAYYRDFRSNLLILLIAALVIALVPSFLKAESKYVKIIADVCRVVVPMIVIYTGVRFLAMRVESFGYIFASNLEAGNEAALNGAMQAVWTLVVFVIAWILTVIVSFFSKKEVVEI